MKTNAVQLAGRRARAAQAKRLGERVRRERANADDAATIRVMLHRVRAIDAWERERLDQAAEQVRASAENKRARFFSRLGEAVDQMRHRGETLANIAALIEADVREVRIALRRARNAQGGERGPASDSNAISQSTRTPLDTSKQIGDPESDAADRPEDGADAYDPTRCVRCDGAMLDVDDGPRRGRRRLYCSDKCRRDASAARTAAERFGSPIRVIEVPRAGSSLKQSSEAAPSETPVPITPLDAVDIALRNDEALRSLLRRVTEQARQKKLNRATFTAARDLAKAVYPHRDS